MTLPLPPAGRYQLDARIGQGATGVVYAATDPDRHRQVAVKVMLPDVAQDPASREHFLREARAISRLRHRHLAAVYDVSSNDEPPFLAMELLRGTTLAERLTQTPALTLIEGLEIVDQLCVGLQCAHEHGLAHRNVTPANIWLQEDGSVKLMDFGLPPTAVPTVADPRAYVGRVAYMSPEQIAGRSVDGRADIFSAGVVLYELVVGRRPFEAESITGIFDKVVNEPAPLVTAGLPPAAAPLHAILKRALEKDPSQRYPEPLEMAADLTLVRIALFTGEAPDSVAVSVDTAEADDATALDLPAFDLTAVDFSPLPAHERALLEEASSIGGGPRASSGSHRAAPDQPDAYEPTLHAHPSGSRAAAAPANVSARTTTQARASAPQSTGLASRISALVDSVIPVLRDNPLAAAGGGAAVALAILVGAWLAWRTPAPVPPVVPSSPTNKTGTPVAGKPAQVQVESEPADAELFVNGATLGVRTPAAVSIDRLRGAELRAVKPGFDPVTVRVAPEDLARGRVTLQLVPEAPPVSVSGSAPFAFEVLNGRIVISRAATSHRFMVRGDAALRVRAPEYFLDRPVTIPPDRSAITLFVPQLGRLSVRTTPALERCSVSIAGRPFGSPPFPPIQYQPIVAGTHRVQLTCPDGSVKTESVAVEAARDRSVVFR